MTAGPIVIKAADTICAAQVVYQSISYFSIGQGTIRVAFLKARFIVIGATANGLEINIRSAW